MQARLAARMGCLALGVGLCACDKQNQGIPPPDDALFFPNGLLLDPRERPAAPVSDPTPTGLARAQFLWALNGNNDLSFNAGTLVAIDLAEFWGAWFDPDTGGVDPWCTQGGRCVQPEGAPTGPDHPCRRIADLPQVVECDEQHFIRATQRIGDFPTLLAASQENGFTRLWMPVRGDPSITYVDLYGAWNDSGRLECDEDDDQRCAGKHVLTHLRNDPSLRQIDREPFNVMVSAPRDAMDPQEERLLFVTHAGTETLTMVDLDGIGDDGDPAIVDLAPNFLGGNLSGGFGLSQYPCDPANAPTLTRGCTRPLVFSGYRYLPFATSFTASGLDEEDIEGDCEGLAKSMTIPDPMMPDQTIEVDVCEAESGCKWDDAAARCVTRQSCAANLDQIGEPGVIFCEPVVRSRAQFPVTALSPDDQTGRPVLGDIAFFPGDSSALWVLQTNPGALIRVDTTLDPQGEPQVFPSFGPIEICDEPTRMALWQDGNDRFALVSCFRAAQLFVVDLVAHRVFAKLLLATGPHDLAVDPEREVVYVANTLEGSISVVDLSSQRTTRFQEMARIGLRDPFKR